MYDNSEIFSRSVRLLGEDSMARVYAARVILFGVGGVGSWVAEGLVRSGVRHLAIVDSDTVAVSNINRQLMATTSTVGQVKVEALRRRLLDINPQAEVVAIHDVYCADNSGRFGLGDYDYVIDAIDSLENKAQLLLAASATDATLFSSMGAALKLDPSRIKVAEFWKVSGCPLGAALRRKFRKKQEMTKKKFLCVYSDELVPNLGPLPEVSPQEPDRAGNCAGEKGTAGSWDSVKAQINGSLVHITAVFGMTLASLVIKDIYTKAQQGNTY